jgi:hypothetical protein
VTKRSGVPPGVLGNRSTRPRARQQAGHQHSCIGEPGCRYAKQDAGLRRRPPGLQEARCQASANLNSAPANVSPNTNGATVTATRTCAASATTWLLTASRGQPATQFGGIAHVLSDDRQLIPEQCQCYAASKSRRTRLLQWQCRKVRQSAATKGSSEWSALLRDGCLSSENLTLGYNGPFIAGGYNEICGFGNVAHVEHPLTCR